MLIADGNKELLLTFIMDTVSETDNTVGPFVGERCYMRSENGRVVMKPLAGSEELLKKISDNIRFLER